MKQITLLITTILIATSITKAELKSESDLRAVADKFMEQVAEAKYKAAFYGVKKHWPMPTEEIDNLAFQTKQQLEMAGTRFGKLIGYEFVEEKSIGESYIRYVYLQKFQNHATRWQIVFYRPETEWKVNVIVWDDKTHELFKE